MNRGANHVKDEKDAETGRLSCKLIISFLSFLHPVSAAV